MKAYSFYLNFLLLSGMKSNADYVVKFAASRETQSLKRKMYVRVECGQKDLIKQLACRVQKKWRIKLIACICLHKVCKIRLLMVFRWTTRLL